jgi:hypothetical protein
MTPKKRYDTVSLRGRIGERAKAAYFGLSLKTTRPFLKIFSLSLTLSRKRERGKL